MIQAPRDVSISKFTEPTVVEMISAYSVAPGHSSIGEEVYDLFSSYLHELCTRPGIIGFRHTEWSYQEKVNERRNWIQGVKDQNNLGNVNTLVEYMTFKTALVRSFALFINTNARYGADFNTIATEMFLMDDRVDPSPIGSLFVSGQDVLLYRMIQHEFQRFMSYLDECILLKLKGD